MHNCFDAHTHYLPDSPTVDTLHCVNAVIEGDWDPLVQSSHQRPDVIPFLGIHPWYVATVSDGWSERLKKKVLSLKGSHLVGIGETGLDRSRDSFDLQREVFRTHLEIAKELHTPISVHCVRAWSDLQELFQSEKVHDTPILLHSFTGNKDVAAQLQKWNVFFSLKICGESYISERGKNSLVTLPKERILLESDNEKDGTKVHHQIKSSYSLGAALLKIPVEEFATLLQENFSRYFKNENK